jgi:23S rRNA (cytidine1920-2'-O)/16S rRNA (cytidine1409-2'-O)-methyltransferase
MSYPHIVLSAPALDAAETAVETRYVSRAGHKLEAALAAFDMNPAGRICADLGANVGGFTDCLLQHGAAKVYAVDTAYGVLAWNLRKDPRVIARDRTNALHLKLPEAASLITVDVGWTKQDKVLPAIGRLLAQGPGDVLSLVKPHYESQLARTQRGVLTPAQSEEVLWQVMDQIAAMRDEVGRGWMVRGIVKSPLEGQKGNVEYIAWLQPSV